LDKEPDYIVFRGGDLDGVWADKSTWPTMSAAKASAMEVYRPLIYKPTEEVVFRDDGKCAQVYELTPDYLEEAK
jgi:hypothetical protein